MFHNRRVWCITQVDSAEELARNLTTVTWTCCTAFELGGYLWLNDATSPDGGQEYSVVKRRGPNGRALQVESITFSWCTEDHAQEHIQRTLRGDDDDNAFARQVSPRLETPEQHGRCPLCA